MTPIMAFLDSNPARNVSGLQNPRGHLYEPLTPDMSLAGSRLVCVSCVFRTVATGHLRIKAPQNPGLPVAPWHCISTQKL